MALLTTKSSSKVEIPPEFTKDVIATINRLEQNITVKGVMYFKRNTVVLYTVPQSIEVILNKRLPRLTRAIERAIKELDVTNDLIAYRIVSKKEEIAVATGPNFSAVVVYQGKECALARCRSRTDSGTSRL